MFFVDRRSEPGPELVSKNCCRRGGGRRQQRGDGKNPAAAAAAAAAAGRRSSSGSSSTRPTPIYNSWLASCCCSDSIFFEVEEFIRQQRQMAGETLQVFSNAEGGTRAELHACTARAIKKISRKNIIFSPLLLRVDSHLFNKWLRVSL